MSTGAHTETWSLFLCWAESGLSHNTPWKELPAHISPAQAWRAVTGMSQPSQGAPMDRKSLWSCLPMPRTIPEPCHEQPCQAFPCCSYPQLACMTSATPPQQMLCFSFSSVHLRPPSQGWCLAQGRWASPRGWKKRSHSIIRRKTPFFSKCPFYPFSAIRLGWTLDESKELLLYSCPISHVKWYLSVNWFALDWCRKL